MVERPTEEIELSFTYFIWGRHNSDIGWHGQGDRAMMEVVRKASFHLELLVWEWPLEMHCS